MRLIPAGLVGFAFFAGLAALCAQTPNADQIMEKNFQVGRLKQSRVLVQMELISSSGDARVRQERSVSKLKANGQDSIGITVFQEPADIKGTAILIDEDRARGDKVWIYLPALKKNRRLPSDEKLESFVGSDFNYGDIIMPRVSDYKHKLLDTEPCPDAPAVLCYVVESVPATPDELAARGVSYRKSWIRSDHFVGVRSEMKDKTGRPWKVLSARDIHDVDGRHFVPYVLEITDLQAKHRTRMTIKTMDISKPVPDSSLKPELLERGITF